MFDCIKMNLNKEKCILLAEFETSAIMKANYAVLEDCTYFAEFLDARISLLDDELILNYKNKNILASNPTELYQYLYEELVNLRQLTKEN